MFVSTKRWVRWIKRKNERQMLTYLFIIFFIGFILFSIPQSWNRVVNYTSWPDIYNHHLLSEDEVKNIELKYTNIPLKYWIQTTKQSIPYKMNSSCAPLPNILELDLTQSLWQSVRLSNATIQMFNAYYDPRPVTSGTNVRIPCMIDRNKIYFTIYCQMWFEGETKPVIEKVQTITYMWFEYWHMHGEKQYGPYLIECRIPESHRSLIPKVVSIVENPCDAAKNLMRVQDYEVHEEKKNFIVCVKGLDFLQEDISVRIAEWLEVLFALGVDKANMYNLSLHPKAKQVIDYYVKQGKVDIRDITLPEGQINIPILQHLFIKSHQSQKRLDEIISYNDCFYRNIDKYKYVVLLDIDEVIVPQQDNDWSGLIERLSNNTNEKACASFNARNVYFLDDMMPEGTFPDIPPYMHILQHVHRCYNFTRPGHYVKSFFNTDHVIACHNHFPFLSNPKTRNTCAIDTSDAYMQHYRSSCQPELNCSEYRSHIVKDTGLWRYKDIVIKNTNIVLENTGLLI